MWGRPTSRVRDVFMGVLIGLGVAGFLVRWQISDDHHKKMLVKRFNDGEKSFMHLVFHLLTSSSPISRIRRNEVHSLGCSRLDGHEQA